MKRLNKNEDCLAILSSIYSTSGENNLTFYFNLIICFTGEDEDAWTFNEVAANWAMEDLESGIKFCKWAIGKYSYKANICLNGTNGMFATEAQFPVFVIR